MRELAVLLLHVLTTIVRLVETGGVRAVVAESVLVKQQLLIVSRSRKRSPRLRFGDRVVAGVCALFVRPSRLVRVAIVLKPSTLLRFHRAQLHRQGQARVPDAQAEERPSRRSQCRPGR